ncbi:exopolysaccharide biosynthesis protein [Aquibaculum arenosum]|uniref:Exopolysaccharide biosynthesis protein n=1 Tax=Aquibaculum arenosum TaxID=3032591 RepID=A0ABT5YKN7_9PROT|nr:exopolysaccharide biosynthesis protein [Fodinicurvata sp. CAU 1616]MDF2095350.1 exopolysaccharide biosynthesis protein [Fodinicurvata sp. CAU 1616]
MRRLVERVESAGGNQDVTIDSILHALGERSFAPLLLVVSVLLVTPVGAVPGAPTIGAVIIALIGLQLLLGRQQLWLPLVLLKRKVSGQKLTRTMRYLEPVAQTIDKLVHPRLPRLVRAPFPRIVGVASVLIALAMPPLEIVPMANAFTALTVALFALALTARDGLLVVIAFLAAAGVAYIVVGGLL